MTPFRSPNLELPWQSSVEEDQRFKRILRYLLIAGLLLGLVVPFIPVPEQAREEQDTLPPQLARVILEEQPPPPPPAPEPEPEPEPEPQPEPEPEPEQPEPEVQPEPEPEPPAPTQVQQARETASRSGLMRHQEDLMAMRDTLNTTQVDSASLTRGENEAAQVDRSMITSAAAGDSGGIDTAALSRDTGGTTELAGRETTQVDSEMDARQAQAEAAAESRPDRAARRSDEDIRSVIDQHMGAIFSIYNRALRQNPALQGKMVVYLVIEPSGEISQVRIESSELNDTDLESRILARIRLITFPGANVAQAEVSYTFDFLPQ